MELQPFCLLNSSTGGVSVGHLFIQTITDSEIVCVEHGFGCLAQAVNPCCCNYDGHC